MKKKILSAFLAVSLVFGAAAALPQNIFTNQTSISASADMSGDYEYKLLESDTLTAFDPEWENKGDIKGILQSLSDDKRAKVKTEICNTLTKIKGKLLDGEVIIHN